MSLATPPHENLRILKLGVLYPLPRELVSRFLAGCRDVLVLEENEPYLETQIKAVAHDSGRRARDSSASRRDMCIARESCFAGRSSKPSSGFFPGCAARAYHEQDEAMERPPRENHCAGCRFGVIVDALREVAAGLGQNPVLVADPGCLTPVADRIDAKFAIGSAVGVAEGLATRRDRRARGRALRRFIVLPHDPAGHR